MKPKQDIAPGPRAGIAAVALVAVLLLAGPLAAARPLPNPTELDPTNPSSVGETVGIPAGLVDFQPGSIQMTYIEYVADGFDFFVMPSVKALAEEHPWHLVVKGFDPSEVSSIGLVIDGQEVDRQPNEGSNIFTDLDVPESLQVSFNTYDVDGVLVDAFVGVQSLLPKALGDGGQPLDDLVVMGGGADWGVVPVFNVQPAEPGGMVQNFLDKLPEIYVPRDQWEGWNVPTNHNYGTAPAKTQANSQAEKCQRNPDNYAYFAPATARRDEQAGSRYSTTNQKLSVLVWRADLVYGHDCYQDVKQGPSGFGYGWTGPNWFQQGSGYSYTLETQNNAEGSTYSRYYSSCRCTTGHIVTVIAAQGFWYDFNNGRVSGVGDYAWGKGKLTSSCSLDVDAVAVNALISTSKMGSALSILGASIPTKYCTKSWYTVTNSFQGRGIGVQASISASSSNDADQVMTKGKGAMELYGQGYFNLNLEGADYVTGYGRYATNGNYKYASGWYSWSEPVIAYLS